MERYEDPQFRLVFARLVVLGDAGHGGDSMSAALVDALDGFRT
jgi:hypothetical protein